MSNYHLTSSPCDKQWCAEYPHTHHSPHQGLQISLWQPSGSVGPTVYSSRFKMGRQRERERERERQREREEDAWDRDVYASTSK